MRKYLRIPSILLIVTMLFGLVPPPARAQVTPTYNPYQGIGGTQFQTGVQRPGDPRYQRGYGNRHDPSYYQPGNYGYQGGHGFTRLIPPLVGAVLGMAMGAKFGLPGAVIGGALGFFGGKAISSAIYGDSYYQGNNDYYFQASNRANYIPGTIGALIGGMLGMTFGWPGMLIGGGIGYLVAKGVARLMFPNLYYGETYRPIPGYGYGGGYGYQPYAGGQVNLRASESAPAAPGSSGDLASLKSLYETTLKKYQDTMAAGAPEPEILEARLAYLAAQKGYLQAMSAAR